MNKHEFEEKVAYYAKKQKLLVPSGIVAVALSGGADSVALLRVLLSLGVECRAFHCNFGLRGEESDRDESFVRSLCLELGVSLEVKLFDVAQYEKVNHVSTEMACRELRYAWFEERVKYYGCVSLAVAHHHDDNIETFFLNMLRGSGIQGLAGIKPRNEFVIRPLLCVTRTEIENYLHEIGQSYVVDSTNLKNDYKRNKIRNVVVPLLNELFPGADVGLARTLSNVQGNNDLYQEMLCALRDSSLQEGRDVSIMDMKAISTLKEGRETALFEMLKSYGFNSEQVADIYNSYYHTKSVGQRFYSCSYEAIVGRENIEIFPKTDTYVPDEFKIDLAELMNASNDVSVLKASLETKPIGEAKISGVDGRSSIALNEKILKDYPVLTLRRWRVGDRIKPYGMKGTRLVSDLFSDAKYSEWQKRCSWLLCADDEVLWVLGLRASNSYKVRHNDIKYILVRFL